MASAAKPQHRLIITLLVLLATAVAIICGLVYAIVLMASHAGPREVIAGFGSAFGTAMLVEVAVIGLFQLVRP